MTDHSQPWQAFVRANVDNVNAIITVDSITTVGSLTIEPSEIVRYEPDYDELWPAGMTQWNVSSPISVMGRVAPGDGGSHDPGPLPRQQTWRLCSLLALAWDQPWYMLHPPQYEHLPLLPGSQLVDPNNIDVLGGCHQGRTRSRPSDRRSPDRWWNGAWTRLSADPDLDGIARMYLTARRALSRGHLEAEIALQSFVSVLDAIGARRGHKSNSARVREALISSYGRHPCPELREQAEDVGRELHRLAYQHRCRVAHEALPLSLIGHRPGPLGDKPHDLAGLYESINTEVLQALSTQARYALKDLLGCPRPEPGQCIHTRTVS